MDEKFAKFHEIDREKIDWHPVIDVDKCIGCGMCVTSCSRKVYAFDYINKKSKVTKPNNCMVACITCANLCPVGAISFVKDSDTARRKAQRILKENRILSSVKKELEIRKNELDSGNTIVNIDGARSEDYTLQNNIRKNNVTFLTLKPVNEGITFKPGQFAMLGLYDKNGEVEERPFSICGASNKSTLQFAVKIVGEFTNRLASITNGEKLHVSGPYGSFIINDEDNDLVFFAGGIGVAPFVSMIRDSVEKNTQKKILLFYSIKTREDIVCIEELESIAEKNKNITIVFTLTKDVPEEWKYDKGRISEEMIKKYCPSFENKRFLLCGPYGFMDTMYMYLVENGAAKDAIMRENF